MQPHIVHTVEERLTSSDLNSVIDVLRIGEVIAYPSDTLYGLGVDALNVEAIKKIFRIKRRDYSRPIPVLVRDIRMLERLIKNIPPLAEHLINLFWPGPLTIVLPADENVPPPLKGNDGKIGVRMSGHPFVDQLFEVINFPLTSTSANPSGHPPATNTRQIQDYFEEGLEIIVDAGDTSSKDGSTVLNVEDQEINIIREGTIPRDEIEECLGIAINKINY